MRMCNIVYLCLVLGSLNLVLCEDEGTTEAPEMPTSTTEPEGSPGCNPPDIRVTKPRRHGQATTAAPNSETTLIEDDFTSGDMKFINHNRDAIKAAFRNPNSGELRMADVSVHDDLSLHHVNYSPKYTWNDEKKNFEHSRARFRRRTPEIIIPGTSLLRLRKDARGVLTISDSGHNSGHLVKRADSDRIYAQSTDLVSMLAEKGANSPHNHKELTNSHTLNESGLLDKVNSNQSGRRVKRKSGKTTGALSRPKSDSGSSSSKSTSRKIPYGIDEDTGEYRVPHPDAEQPESSKEETTEDLSEGNVFREVTEVRFPSGETGPMGDRRVCKIICSGGKWVGPLCASVDDEPGSYKPLYKRCKLNRIFPNLSLSYRNISVDVGWDLPHGHFLQARCSDLGMYKLLGESRVLCSNGLWAPRMPSCVPTTLLTNYSDDSPPSIRIKVAVGSGSFEPSGVLAVLPSSILHLDCMYPRKKGTPEWSWTGWFRQYITGWSALPDEKATRYRLTIKDIQAGDSGTYTCATPRGVTNSIVLVITVSTCAIIVDPVPPLQLRLEGNKLGQRALYRCPLGYSLEGTANATCLASGNWSSQQPSCQPIHCPQLYLEEPHLSLVELNSSAFGKASFKCAWGYKLNGPPSLDCDPSGVWSGPEPRCRAIQCPPPLVPINGRIDGTSYQRRYAVGALVTFSCTEGHLLVGLASIVCTETGFWSHAAPFCKAQCPYPGDPPNGLIAPLKFHYDPGDELTVQCRPGFVEVNSVNRPHCLADGNWSATVPKCRNYEEV